MNQQLIEIQDMKGYFIDTFGKIKYLSNGKWMFCKKDVNKKGNIMCYKYGQLVSISESEVADIYVPNWKAAKKRKFLIDTGYVSALKGKQSLEKELTNKIKATNT